MIIAICDEVRRHARIFPAHGYHVALLTAGLLTLLVSLGATAARTPQPRRAPRSGDRPRRTRDGVGRAAEEGGWLKGWVSREGGRAVC